MLALVDPALARTGIDLVAAQVHHASREQMRALLYGQRISGGTISRCKRRRCIRVQSGVNDLKQRIDAVESFVVGHVEGTATSRRRANLRVAGAPSRRVTRHVKPVLCECMRVSEAI